MAFPVVPVGQIVLNHAQEIARRKFPVKPSFNPERDEGVSAVPVAGIVGCAGDNDDQDGLDDEQGDVGGHSRC